MLKHCVFVNLRDDVSPQDRDRVLKGFGELVTEVDGMLDYASGPNLDFESKSPNHRFGFIVTFRDRDAHLEYETHPLHIKLGQELVAMCNGGYEGIVVYDIQY